MKLAGELDWGQLSRIVGNGVVAAAKSIAQQEYDVLTGRTELPPGARPQIKAELLAKYVGRHADDDVNWTPHSVTVEGMDRALRDVWEHVHTPDGAPATCPPKPRAEQ